MSHTIRQASGLRDNDSSQNTSSGLHGFDSGRTGYDPSPLSQGQETTEAQCDPSRFGEADPSSFGEEGTKGKRGIGIGTYLGQDTGKCFFLVIFVLLNSFLPS